MSASKQKGTAWETAVVRYLERWWPARRNPPAGANDTGDIDGTPSIIEAKNHKSLDLAGWLAEAHAERDKAGEHIGVVWHKRRGKTNPGDGYVTMDGQTFVFMLLLCEQVPVDKWLPTWIRTREDMG